MDANYLIWLLCFNQSECSILMRIYMDNYIKIFCLYLATMLYLYWLSVYITMHSCYIH